MKLFNDKEHKFWDWFISKSDYIYNNLDNDQDNIFRKLRDKLKKINKFLTFQFSPINNNGKREFIVSADGIKNAFPNVVKLVEKSPKLEKWEIIAFRQRVQIDNFELNFQNISLSYDDLFFTYTINVDKVNLILYIRNFENNDSYIGASFLLLDSLLGEYDVEMKIDQLEFQQLVNNKIDNLLNIRELTALIDSLKK